MVSLIGRKKILESSKFFYKIFLAFKGTKYFGWQTQNNTDLLTAQGVLNATLKEICKSEDVKTFASGRTDTGVHSLLHVVKLECTLDIEPISFEKALNSLLPMDIRVDKVEKCTDTFHPLAQIVSKEYRYYFSNTKKVTAFQEDYLANISHDLDLNLMRKAAAEFVGTHDFHYFHCVGSDSVKTVRTIFECEILGPHKVTELPLFPEFYVIRVRGEGFLKQMVRMLVGAIWSVGRGQLQLVDLKNMLAAQAGMKKAFVAPPNGLYKFNVEYKDQ
jgi:tRNA pseudouridine38-40 synthase